MDGHVLLYVHKDEASGDVERRCPAAHSVLASDKLRMVAAVKEFWNERVTTAFLRRGT